MKLLLNSSWLQAHGTRMKAAVRPPEILVINISNLSPLTNKAERMVRYELMIEIIVTRQ